MLGVLLLQKVHVFVITLCRIAVKCVKNRRLSINCHSRYNKKGNEAFMFLINIMYDCVVVHGTVTIAP